MQIVKALGAVTVYIVACAVCLLIGAFLGIGFGQLMWFVMDLWGI